MASPVHANPQGVLNFGTSTGYIAVPAETGRPSWRTPLLSKCSCRHPLRLSPFLNPAIAQQHACAGYCVYISVLNSS